MSNRWGKGFDVNQLQLNWQDQIGRTQKPGVERPQRPNQASTDRSSDSGKPVLRLRWDFRTRFPEPTDDAMNEGIIQPEDAQPENLAALHLAHADRMLATLSDIDAAAQAVRLRADPKTARNDASGNEPGRLKRWYESLLGAYRDWFGDEAADAFDKAVRAWHARIEVVIDNGLARDEPSQNDPPVFASPIQFNRPDHDSVAVIAQAEPAPVEVNSNLPLLPAPKEPAPSKPVRVIARLPVPRPLPEAVKAGDFGRGEDGRYINPSPAEVREITENHAEQLLLIIQEGCGADKSRQGELARQYDAGIALYARSFGASAAERLDAYVRRQAKSEHIAPVWRSPDSSHRR